MSVIIAEWIGLLIFRYILVDISKSVEAFLWANSGAQLLETLASFYPTIIAYVLDSTRASQLPFFLSNMLYASSISRKSSLPLVLVCNKTDLTDAMFIEDWLTDTESFQLAVSQQKLSAEAKGFISGPEGHMGAVLQAFRQLIDVYIITD